MGTYIPCTPAGVIYLYGLRTRWAVYYTYRTRYRYIVVRKRVRIHFLIFVCSYVCARILFAYNIDHLPEASLNLKRFLPDCVHSLVRPTPLREYKHIFRYYYYYYTHTHTHTRYSLPNHTKPPYPSSDPCRPDPHRDSKSAPRPLYVLCTRHRDGQLLTVFK